MFIRYTSRSKKFANITFLTFLIPYLLLTLTMGGFHNGGFGISDCNHAQTFVFDETTDAQIQHQEETNQHDPETCQICQWLKSSSITSQFFTYDAFFGNVFVVSASSYHALPAISIHKFTIRPPPIYLYFF